MRVKWEYRRRNKQGNQERGYRRRTAQRTGHEPASNVLSLLKKNCNGVFCFELCWSPSSLAVLALTKRYYPRRFGITYRQFPFHALNQFIVCQVCVFTTGSDFLGQFFLIPILWSKRKREQQKKWMNHMEYIHTRENLIACQVQGCGQTMWM